MSYFSFIPYHKDIKLFTLNFRNQHFESEFVQRRYFGNIKRIKIELLFIVLSMIICFIIETQTIEIKVYYALAKILTVLIIFVLIFLFLNKMKKFLRLLVFSLSASFLVFFFYELEILTQNLKTENKFSNKLLFMYSFLYFQRGAFMMSWILKSIEVISGLLYLIFISDNIDLDIRLVILILLSWFSIINYYLDEKQSRECFCSLKDANSLMDKYQYLLKEVDPGINILLKQTEKTKNKKKVIKPLPLFKSSSETTMYEIEYINTWAKEKYSLESLDNVMNFFEKIFIKEGTDSKKKTIKSYLETIMNPLVSRNSFDFLPAKIFNCYKKESLEISDETDQKKLTFSVVFCVYEWKSEIYVLVRLNDIHLEEEMEKLRELDRFKDQLLANITHDLRTPLNGMIYFIKQAQEIKQDEAELNKLLGYAEINGNLLMNLIGDILDRSLLKANKMRLNIRKFALKTILDEILILLKPKAEFQSIKLCLLYLCKKELVIESDSDRLKQVLINLIGNAIKFTKRGFVKIRVYKKTEKFINFEIIDSGIGISKKDINRLGTPFNTHDTHGMNGKGIGLGLSIAKEIIGKLGPKAELYISSRPAFGSKFAFRIFKSFEKKENTGEQILKIKPIIHPLAHNKFFNFEKLDLKHQYTDFSNDRELTDKNIEDSQKEEEFSEVDSADLQLESQISMNFSLEEIDEKTKNNEKENDLSPLSVKTFFERRSKKKTMFSLNKKIGLFPKKNILTPQQKLNSVLRQLKKPLKILIVDDNLFNILILEKFLKKLQKDEKKDLMRVEKEFAHNGEIAVEKFKICNKSTSVSPFNIIIMDCEMPIMNGFEASIMINNLIGDENYIKCEIIAFTALNLESEVKRCKEHGMNYFLFKPCNENELFNMLYKSLKGLELGRIYDSNLNLHENIIV